MPDVIDELQIEVKEVGETSGDQLKALSSSLVKLKNTVEKFGKLNTDGIQRMREMTTAIKQLSRAGSDARFSQTISNLKKLSHLNIAKATKTMADIATASQVPEVETPTVTAPEPQIVPSVIEPNIGFDGSKITALAKIKDIFDGFKTKVKESTAGLDKFFQSIKRIAFYRLIRTGLQAITDGIREGIQNVYQWSAAFGGTFAQSMDRIATSANYLKNSLGAMSTPLINALAPVIDFLIDKFVDLLNIINQVFARLSGASTWTRALKTQTAYAKSVGSAAQQVKNLISGFDEINNIGGDTGGGSGASDAGNFDFVEEAIDTKKIDDIIDKLKEIGTFALAIGTAIKLWKFANSINDLTTISSILKGIAGLGVIAVSFYLQYQGIKDIMGNGINAGNFIETVLGGLGLAGGGAMLGNAITTALGSAVSGIAIGGGIGAIFGGGGMLFGGIWSAMKEGLNWLNGILIPSGSTLLGGGIGAIIGSLGGPIGTGVGALIGLAVGLVTDGVLAIIDHADDIKDWWNGTVKPWFSNVGKSISTWFTDRIKGIREWFGDIKTEVANFFSNLGTTVSNKVKDIINKYIITNVNRFIGWVNDKLHFSFNGLYLLGKQVLPSFNITLAHLNTLPQLATGTNYVPQDQLAMIHKGEAVIPKEFNSDTYFNNEETNDLLRTLIREVQNMDLQPVVRVSDIGKSTVKYIQKQQRIMGGVSF